MGLANPPLSFAATLLCHGWSALGLSVYGLDFIQLDYLVRVGSQDRNIRHRIYGGVPVAKNGDLVSLIGHVADHSVVGVPKQDHAFHLHPPSRRDGVLRLARSYSSIGRSGSN